MIRIFLVDEHEIVRFGLSFLLKSWGHVVVGESADIEDSLEQLQLLKPDIVLLDLQLKDGCGLNLLSELKRRGILSFCIVLTMVASPRMVADALALGARGYVLKESAAYELKVSIESAANGKLYLGEKISQIAVQSLSQRESSDPMKALSKREIQVISLVVNGHTSAEIGVLLNLSPKTVATYRSRLMSKLSVADVPALVRMAIRHNLINADGGPSRSVHFSRSLELARTYAN